MKQSDHETVEHIEHDAIVVKADPATQMVTVKVADNDDCGSCPAARLCSLADSSNSSTISLKSEMASSLHPGDRVIIRGTEQMHRRAIMLATVIPCIILIMVMVGVFIITDSQLAAAAGGIASMLFFFLLLYLLRNRVAHEFNFIILPYSQS